MNSWEAASQSAVGEPTREIDCVPQHCPQIVEVLDRLTVAPAEISSDVALELARLDPGEVSYNLTRDDGQTLVFLMMCGRNQAGSDSIDPSAVRNQITSQRLAGMAEALVADLRASAVITSR